MIRDDLYEFLRHRLKAEETLEHAALIKTRQAIVLLRSLQGDEPPRWRIGVSSAWSTEGEPSLDPRVYVDDSLRNAIRRAATDFSMGAGRQYPGKKYSDLRTSTSWDVQGEWTVGIVVGDRVLSLPKEMWDAHVQELSQETGQDWSPEARREVTLVRYEALP